MTDVKFLVYQNVPLTQFSLKDGTHYEVDVNGVRRKKFKLDRKAKKLTKTAKCETVEFVQAQHDGTMKKEREILVRLSDRTLVLNK